MSSVTDEPIATRFGSATPGRRSTSVPPPVGPPSEPETETKRHRWRLLVAAAAVVVLALGMVTVGRATAPGPGPAPLPVLATRTAVPAGSKLASTDLMVVDIDRTARGRGGWLPATDERRVVGRALARPLPAGALLSSADLTTGAFPPAGQSLIGLELKGSEVPTGALNAGDAVTVVYVPAATQPPYPSPMVVTKATVWGVTSGQSGSTDVDVLVPTSDAATLSAAASHDEISLIRSVASR